MQQPRLSAASKGLSIGIIGIQLFDIAVHAATDQLEPVRVVSNILILVWVAALLAGRIRRHFVPTAVGAIGGYLLINIFFLATEGLQNAGEPRTMLFLLVCSTVALSTLLTVQVGRSVQSTVEEDLSDV